MTTEIRWQHIDQFALLRHTESLDDDIREQAENEQLRRRNAGREPSAVLIHETEEAEP